MVAGGGDDRLPLGERILDSAEVYNPGDQHLDGDATDDRRPSQPPRGAAEQWKVLAVGGTDDEEIRTGNGTAKSTAELFRP